MEPTRRGQALKPIAAIALLLVGVASLGLWRLLGGSEQLPYRSDAEVPSSSLVTQDQSYSLAVPGGVQAMLQHGVPVAGGASGETINLQCRYTAGGVANQSLAVSAESTSTKATNVVGSFTSPISGRISVSCTGWGAMFVPNADDRPSDNSGAALLVATIAITIGACLALSAIHDSRQRKRTLSGVDDASSDGYGEDDEVERLVDVARPLPHHHEVVDADGDDIGQ